MHVIVADKKYECLGYTALPYLMVFYFDFTNPKKSGCQLKKTLERLVRKYKKVVLHSALVSSEQEMIVWPYAANSRVEKFSANIGNGDGGYGWGG